MTFIHSLIRIRNPTHFLCYLVCLLLFLNSWIKISFVECTFRGFKLHANFKQSLKQLRIICKGFFVCHFTLNCHPHRQQATCEDNLKTQCLNFVEKCLMPFSFQTKLVSPFVLMLYKVSSTQEPLQHGFQKKNSNQWNYEQTRSPQYWEWQKPHSFALLSRSRSATLELVKKIVRTHFPRDNFDLAYFLTANSSIDLCGTHPSRPYIQQIRK